MPIRFQIETNEFSSASLSAGECTSNNRGVDMLAKFLYELTKMDVNPSDNFHSLTDRVVSQKGTSASSNLLATDKILVYCRARRICIVGLVMCHVESQAVLTRSAWNNSI